MTKAPLKKRTYNNRPAISTLGLRLPAGRYLTSHVIWIRQPVWCFHGCAEHYVFIFVRYTIPVDRDPYETLTHLHKH